jgi:two-component system chemotaxis sensor kinase CheA
MSDDMSQYTGMFITESREYIQNLNQSLLDLEKNVGRFPSGTRPTSANRQRNDPAALDEIFRYMHTLKGMSASMGFKKMEKLCHESENLLGELRNKREIHPNLVNTLFFRSMHWKRC